VWRIPLPAPDEARDATDFTLARLDAQQVERFG
jgi:hypothetical protein